MKAPFSWPNDSEAIRSLGIAAQFTPTNGRDLRSDLRWIARATSSLPVPVSPITSTVESLGAALEIRDSFRFSMRERFQQSLRTSMSCRFPRGGRRFPVVTFLQLACGLQCRSRPQRTARYLSLCVDQRIVSDQKPAILSVVSKQPRFVLIRRVSLRPPLDLFQVIRMKSCLRTFFLPLLGVAGRKNSARLDWQEMGFSPGPMTATCC